MNIPDPASNSNNFDHVLTRLQKLALSPSSLISASRARSDSPQDHCSLGPPFAMSYSCPSKEVDDVPTIIDTFSPRPFVYDLSPTSSASSDYDSPSSHTSFPRASFEAFVATRSRVVRVCGAYTPAIVDADSIFSDQLYNLPRMAEAFLSAVFLPQSVCP